MEKGATCLCNSLAKADQCCSMIESPDIPSTVLEISWTQQITCHEAATSEFIREEMWVL